MCVFVALNFIILIKDARGDIASVEYVDKIVLSLQPNNNVQVDWNQTDASAPNYILNKPDLLVYDEHIQSAQKPHNVTKRQIGLANVQDVDTTNADNITFGTVACWYAVWDCGGDGGSGVSDISDGYVKIYRIG